MSKHWCLDNWKVAIETFRQNFPKSIVVQHDIKVLLFRIARDSGREHDVTVSGKSLKQEAQALPEDVAVMLPKPGDIGIIISGTTCQVRCHEMRFHA